MICTSAGTVQFRTDPTERRQGTFPASVSRGLNNQLGEEIKIDDYPDTWDERIKLRSLLNIKSPNEKAKEIPKVATK